MCGIAGFWLENASDENSWFDVCLTTLQERGPDGHGTELLDDRRLLLGHRRLAIIDVSERGRQPLPNEDGSVWITFNGEIYNYKRLRQQLREHGHIFKTETDTEVVVHAYEEWGTNCVLRLNGIFAFAIWDQAKRELFLARDHVGIKPLYFTQNRHGFGFASQPKAIVAAPFVEREVSSTGLRDYLSFGYIPAPKCIFKGVEKLPPAHWMTVSSSGIRQERYWKAEYRPSITRFSHAVEATLKRLSKIQ